MSTFYGSLKGCRGEVTRTGSTNSGIRSSLQSYQGSIITTLYKNSNDELSIRIDRTDNSSSLGYIKFSGTMKEFDKLLELNRKLQSGEVVIKEVK